MFKPLLRTLPAMSGNITLACRLDDISGIGKKNMLCVVRHAVLAPLNNSLYNNIYNVSLLTGKWEFDVSKYFYWYKDSFYNTNFEFDRDNRQPYNTTYNYTEPSHRQTDYEMGCKRLPYGKTGYQCMFYAPVYIDSTGDIPDAFVLSIYAGKIKKKVTVSLKDTQDNWLYKYIRRYTDKLDNNVIYMAGSSNQAKYYGIDCDKGGFKSVMDNIVGQLYNRQTSINNFDYILTSGFSRNNMIIRQVLPLSFLFNIQDFLTEKEYDYFKWSDIKITGEYIKNGAACGFYDFSINYSDFHPEIKRFDTDKYIYTESSDNVMNQNYPALNESRYINYKYTNKLTPMYGRWRLQASKDDKPYITNMSFAFTYMTPTGSEYGEYPLIYNIEKPAASIYLDNMTAYTGSYIWAAAQNKYISGWYTPVNDSNITYQIYNDTAWSDIVNGKVYHKGILYDLGENTTGKFGVFVKPEVMDITDETYSGDLIISYLNDDASNLIYDNNILLKQDNDGAFKKVLDYDTVNTYYLLDDIDNINNNVNIINSYLLIPVGYKQNVSILYTNTGIDTLYISDSNTVRKQRLSSSTGAGLCRVYQKGQFVKASDINASGLNLTEYEYIPRCEETVVSDNDNVTVLKGTDFFRKKQKDSYIYVNKYNISEKISEKTAYSLYAGIDDLDSLTELLKHNVTDNIYIKTRGYTVNNGRLIIADRYDKINIDSYDDISCINGLFTLTKDNIQTECRLYYKSDFYKMDGEIYDLMNLDDPNYDGDYNQIYPLLIYIKDTDIYDFDNIFENISDSDIVSAGESLSPLYTDIYKKDKEQKKYFKNLFANRVTLSDDGYYIYDREGEHTDVYVNKNIKGLDYILSSENYSRENTEDISLEGAGLNSFMSDNIEYSYYLIRHGITLTGSAFNTLYNTSSEFSYINNIPADEYITYNYNDLVPFFKVQPFDIFADTAYTMYSPQEYSLALHYRQYIMSGNRSDSYSSFYTDDTYNLYNIMFVNDTSNIKMTLNRYLDFINPVLTAAMNIDYLYNLELTAKDPVNDGQDNMYFLKNVSIYSNPGVLLDGDNINLYEDKYFNDSKVILIPPEITVTMSGLYIYDDIVRMETDSSTFTVFKEKISKKIDDNTARYLYNKYDKKYISNPEKYNLDGDKLYSLIYKFILL